MNNININNNVKTSIVSVAEKKEDKVLYSIFKRLLDILGSLIGLTLLSPILKDQNEMSGPMFKIKDDPRITKIGKFIRKTSIDELPQLINVLKGDMSLVGPRPSLPNEVKEFEPWMLKRFEIKPGLTCYWQVMVRNSIVFEEWMKLDIRYVHERSFVLDIKLIFKTFFVLFGDNNAA